MDFFLFESFLGWAINLYNFPLGNANKSSKYRIEMTLDNTKTKQKVSKNMGLTGLSSLGRRIKDMESEENLTFTRESERER